MTLTDGFYGDREFSTWDGHDLYVPDLAVGRSVETPAEIEGQIEYFALAGERTVNQALVTGYDFLQDASQEICATIDSHAIVTDCDLVSDTWGLDGLRQPLFRSTNDLVSLNQHSNHHIYGVPAATALSTEMILDDATDLSGQVIYSSAPHAGLNVPPQDPYESLDWPQALAEKGAVYISSTGHIWGSSNSVALTESLVVSLTRHLVSGHYSSIGDAMVSTKQEYYEDTEPFDVYDEKVLAGFVLSGLPMYSVTVEATKADAYEPDDTRAQASTIATDGPTQIQPSTSKPMRTGSLSK